MPALKSTNPFGSPGSFQQGVTLETKTWALGLLAVTRTFCFQAFSLGRALPFSFPPECLSSIYLSSLAASVSFSLFASFLHLQYIHSTHQPSFLICPSFTDPNRYMLTYFFSSFILCPGNSVYLFVGVCVYCWIATFILCFHFNSSCIRLVYQLEYNILPAVPLVLFSCYNVLD